MPEHFYWLVPSVVEMQKEDPKNAIWIGEVAFNLYMANKIMNKNYYKDYSDNDRIQFHNMFVRQAEIARDIINGRDVPKSMSDACMQMADAVTYRDTPIINYTKILKNCKKDV